MRGDIVMRRAREYGAEIVPVDSEHSAIFQCLTGRAGELHKILLTGSGGPFRGWTREQTRDVTPEMAVSHPNWSMGAKISVDSATMMNKGLEFIEAMHLFGVTPDDIQVLIHPESVVHSMVELLDGTVIAQLGVPDMGLPIQYALTYPERKPSRSDRLDLTAYPNGLHFYEPDLEALPCLALAMRCARTGGTAPTVMNAANEIAVGLFLGHKIGYHSIYESVAAAVEAIAPVAAPDLDVIRAADQEARALRPVLFPFLKGQHMYILFAILVFGILIAVHELGHFLVAKACGVRVDEFAIGMGPAIWKKQKGETLYARSLPADRRLLRHGGRG